MAESLLAKKTDLKKSLREKDDAPRAVFFCAFRGNVLALLYIDY